MPVGFANAQDEPRVAQPGRTTCETLLVRVDSHVAWSETAGAVMAVFDKAVAAHGVPQRLLSDNRSTLNPSRRNSWASSSCT